MISAKPGLKLVEPDKINENEFSDFINEFKAVNETLAPYSLNQQGRDFRSYVKALKDESMGRGLPEDWVPASTFFLVDDKHNTGSAKIIQNHGGELDSEIEKNDRVIQRYWIIL